MSKPEKKPPKELSREALLEKLVAHGHREAQLERLEELQRLLQPVKVTLNKLVDVALFKGGFDSILWHLPQTMIDNVARSSELLGVSKEQFVTAALEEPALFGYKSQTLADNVAGSRKLLGVSKEQFVTAALKRPRLFYQKPETLADNVARSSELLGVSKEQFVTAALKHPPLFGQKPETLAKHGYYIKRIMEHLKEPKPFGEFIAKNPVGLTFANENLLGRTILAQQGASPTKGAKFLIGNVTKTDAQAALINHYTGRVLPHAKTGEPLQAGERMIQTLHHIGVLDTLPEGMGPLKDERSISMLEKVLAVREAEKAKQKSKER